MENYRVVVREILSCVIEVKAKNCVEATKIVETQYDRGEIRLDYRDYSGYDIKCISTDAATYSG